MKSLQQPDVIGQEIYKFYHLHLKENDSIFSSAKQLYNSWRCVFIIKYNSQFVYDKMFCFVSANNY